MNGTSDICKEYKRTSINGSITNNFGIMKCLWTYVKDWTILWLHQWFIGLKIIFLPRFAILLVKILPGANNFSCLPDNSNQWMPCRMKNIVLHSGKRKEKRETKWKNQTYRLFDAKQNIMIDKAKWIITNKNQLWWTSSCCFFYILCWIMNKWIEHINK